MGGMTNDRKTNPKSDTSNGLFRVPLSGALGLGIGFDRNIHEEFVQNRGEQVIHSMAVSCPKCRTGSRSDGVLVPHVQSVCDVCSGVGWVYRNTRRIMGVITGIRSNRGWMQLGLLNPGDCSISVSPKLTPPLSDFDLITFTWPQPLDDGQVVVRGDDYRREQELLARPEVRQLTELEDRLMYRAADVLWVEDELGKTYYDGADFVLDGKVIRWRNPPADRVRYTIKYRCYYEWVVFASPFERYDQGESLGQQAVLRKRHVVFTTDDPHSPDGLTGEARKEGISSTKV